MPELPMSGKTIPSGQVRAKVSVCRRVALCLRVMGLQRPACDRRLFRGVGHNSLEVDAK